MTVAVLLFAGTTTMEFLISSYQMEVLLTAGCRIRPTLMGLVFKKRGVPALYILDAGFQGRRRADNLLRSLALVCP
ncbi:hypothetical protein HPB48_026711 [Haemaphysalis longicornis]|uniref:Uncharacterized protein n=1 Tax=Haemaphysalis longicornis TaxID=44386 RepID=A0A9J6HBG6_HAELO|nr:hypothetical protein HPB48_026711 [Haemaphysalis longicornis]